MKTAKAYISRSAKAVYHRLYNALKTVYDMALDPVKFEELKEMTHGERRREIDRMLEEYRKKRQTSEQHGVPVEYLKEESDFKMETQTEKEVRLMEDKVCIMKTRIDNAEYFRRVCGGYSGPTEELKIEEAKLEGLYEKRRRKEQERIEQPKRERQKGEPYDKHMAMCNGVPVW